MALPPLFKRSTAPGAPWCIRFMHMRKLYQWSTKTTDKDLAKIRARTYWEAVKAENFPVADLMKSGVHGPTFEKLFEQYMTMPTPPDRTKAANIRAMKAVLAGSGLTPVDPIARLDVQRALTFQRAYMADRKDAPAAIVTCNAKLRKAKSLFGRRAMVCYTIDLPDRAIASFKSVPMLKEPEPRRELPTQEAQDRAMAALPAYPTAFRAYLLARYGGLRAAEIKAARRDWVEGNVLYVGGKPSEFVTKSRKWRAVRLPEEVVAILSAHDDPVSLVGPMANNVVNKVLPGLLIGLGFPAHKPLHSCRRMFGSILYDTQSPQAAKNALGHQNIATTERSYVRSSLVPAPVPFTAPAASLPSATAAQACQ